MTAHTNLTYQDLDWTQLWESARKQRNRPSKDASTWNARSRAFAKRNRNSLFAKLLVEQLPLDAETTVLDIGCGPGTLALPIAKKCRQVSAVDFSSEMLTILNERAEKARLTNITTIECAWESNWDKAGIVPHDIAIAARSLGVANLEQALKKLVHYSKKYVFIADRIHPTPVDPEAFAAIGRPLPTGPDYIYTINMLYSMDIHPNVVVLPLEKEFFFSSIEEAYQSYAWMFSELTGTETEKLRSHVAQKAEIIGDGTLRISRETPPRWALIWWQK